MACPSASSAGAAWFRGARIETCARRYRRRSGGATGLLRRRRWRWWRRTGSTWGWRRRSALDPATRDELPVPVRALLPVCGGPRVTRLELDPSAVDPQPVSIPERPVTGLPGVAGSFGRHEHDAGRRRSGRAHDYRGEDGRVGRQEEKTRAPADQASGGQECQKNRKSSRHHRAEGKASGRRRQRLAYGRMQAPASQDCTMLPVVSSVVTS